MEIPLKFRAVLSGSSRLCRCLVDVSELLSMAADVSEHLSMAADVSEHLSMSIDRYYEQIVKKYQ